MIKILGVIWGMTGIILFIISFFATDTVSTISFRDIAGLILIGFAITWLSFKC